MADGSRYNARGFRKVDGAALTFIRRVVIKRWRRYF